jgi:hypothetical protein
MHNPAMHGTNSNINCNCTQLKVKKVYVVQGDQKVYVVQGDQKVCVVQGDQKVCVVQGDQKVSVHLMITVQKHAVGPVAQSV